MERKITESNTATQALRKITHGFYVITSRHDNEIAAGIVQWVTQACFEPALLVACIQKESYLNEVITESNAFAVNILGEDQKHFVSPFSKPTKITDNQLNGFPFQEGKTGSPLLIDVPVFIECRAIEAHSKGDHTIFIGEVVNTGVKDQAADPLVEWNTEYHYGG